MNTPLRPLIAVFALTFALAAPAVEMAVPFRPITFDEATQAAAQENKLVFVDFFTTWCEPCKRLDADTFTDAGVGRLVGGAAVALKLDAEKEGLAVAKRYKVSAYPTLLLVKADGTEVDRIVGYRPPAPFMTEFKNLLVMAQTGRTGLEQARSVVAQQAKPDVAGGDAEDAQPHFDLAKKLIVAGNYEEALFSSAVSMLEQSKLRAKSGGPGMTAAYIVARSAKQVEALAGAGQLDQARELGERLLAFDSSDETKELLTKHVTRAGQPGLFAAPPIVVPKS